jgi:hypothetical protein
MRMVCVQAHWGAVPVPMHAAPLRGAGEQRQSHLCELLDTVGGRRDTPHWTTGCLRGDLSTRRHLLKKHASPSPLAHPSDLCPA